MRAMRRLVFQLHLIGALVGAVFISILGLTGAIMAFEPELDRVTHPGLLVVAPNGPPKALTELARLARAAHPGRVRGYGIGRTADAAWYVTIDEAAVFIDPYSGRVLGERRGRTWLDTIHQLHLRLLAGQTGKTIVSWAGLLVLGLAVSGLCLWWPVKRLSVRWSAGGRRRWFDLHNVVGVCAFALLFLLALTGVMIGFERITTPLLYGITGTQPVAPAATSVPAPNGRVVSPDVAIAAAAAVMPGASPIGVNATAGTAPYRVALCFPEDRTPGGRSRVWIDPATGAVLQTESSRTAPAGTRLLTLNRAIHTGDLFGVPTKLLMSVGSLAAVAQVGTGLLMWWKRRRPAA